MFALRPGKRLLIARQTIPADHLRSSLSLVPLSSLTLRPHSYTVQRAFTLCTAFVVFLLGRSEMSDLIAHDKVCVCVGGGKVSAELSSARKMESREFNASNRREREWSGVECALLPWRSCIEYGGGRWNGYTQPTHTHTHTQALFGWVVDSPVRLSSAMPRPWLATN